jgi:hypothetical protein
MLKKLKGVIEPSVVGIHKQLALSVPIEFAKHRGTSDEFIKIRAQGAYHAAGEDLIRSLKG